MAATVNSGVTVSAVYINHVFIAPDNFTLRSIPVTALDVHYAVFQRRIALTHISHFFWSWFRGSTWITRPNWLAHPQNSSFQLRIHQGFVKGTPLSLCMPAFATWKAQSYSSGTSSGLESAAFRPDVRSIAAFTSLAYLKEYSLPVSLPRLLGPLRAALLRS